jgi:hypothetical protein
MMPAPVLMCGVAAAHSGFLRQVAPNWLETMRGPLTTIALISERRAIIEVKTGGATLTANQSARHPAAQLVATTGVGVNADQAGMLGSFGSTPVYVLRQ